MNTNLSCSIGNKGSLFSNRLSRALLKSKSKKKEFASVDFSHPTILMLDHVFEYSGKKKYLRSLMEKEVLIGF